jgi:hypothetical protein
MLLATVVSVCFAVTAGCATPPERADRLAAEAGFTRELRTGTQFQHVVYRHGMDARNLDELHIYIEGDGTPWIAGQSPAQDPTPRNPLALQMMRLDPAPSLYLGRPCYFGLATSAGCHADYWTSKRYSPEVVASMSSVIEYYQQAYGAGSIVLIGYSGGGALAALLAREVQGRQFLLTVAADLDTDLWTELRGFAPLSGSLNPLHYRAALAPVPQLHLAGEQDDIVPVEITRSYAATLDPDFFRYYPGFDHVCCWLQLWPKILTEGPWTSMINR